MLLGSFELGTERFTYKNLINKVLNTEKQRLSGFAGILARWPTFVLSSVGRLNFPSELLLL
jgi:hypothetical protein